MPSVTDPENQSMVLFVKADPPTGNAFIGLTFEEGINSLEITTENPLELPGTYTIYVKLEASTPDDGEIR